MQKMQIIWTIYVMSGIRIIFWQGAEGVKGKEDGRACRGRRSVSQVKDCSVRECEDDRQRSIWQKLQ